MDPPGTPAADLKGRTNGLFEDGPLTLRPVPSVPTVTLFWNSTFSSSANPFNCTVTDGATNVATGVFFGCMNYTVSDCKSKTLRIFCSTGTTPKDTLQVNIVPSSADIKADGSDGPISVPLGQSYTISWTSTDVNDCEVVKNGVRGWASGTSGSQADVSFTPGQFVYEVFCTNACGWVSGSPLDSVVVNVTPIEAWIFVNNQRWTVSVTPDVPYTVSWQIENATSSQCVIQRDGATWVTNPAVPTGSQSDVIYDGECATDADCGPWGRCVGGGYATVSHEYVLTCTNGGATATDSVTAQAQVRMGTCVPRVP